MTTLTRTGLSSTEAAARLRRHGPNVLPTQRRRSPLLLLGKQLVHFFALLLWLASGLALIGGMPELAIAIVVVVVVNAVFAFVQEYRADQAAQHLRSLIPERAVVLRNGKRVEVDAADLVVDDVVLLAAGDRVSADLLLLSAAGLSVDESALTGESVPVHKTAEDRAHAGTYVVEGEAAAVVTATGKATRIAGIAELTVRAERPPSPLTVRLNRVVKVVALVAVALGVVFFAVALALGMTATEGFLFAVGVTVALVPEGLLPTVTLSLARAARVMADRKALVRRLDAVETLGATTFICTDKTGTLTRNEMAVVRVTTPAGVSTVDGVGYEPDGTVHGDLSAVRALADSARRCSPDARAVLRDGHWRPLGDPMEVALHVLAARAGLPDSLPPAALRLPFDPRRRRSSVSDVDGLHVTGAPDSVLPLCREVPHGVAAAVAEFARQGLRVLAVARGRGALPGQGPEEAERDLELLGVVGLQDPPRDDVGEAITRCRTAGIRLAMITGDHRDTARAVAEQVGLLGPDRIVVEGKDLPRDPAALGELLDHDGVVVARVTPEDKLRIARALQTRGHVVAMTGDGVNDGPALRAADIGIAMGASGTDVAREAADLVLLDDRFATIVGAVELGRATFANIRRFLTYHLTDNVAELAPFALWALSGGSIPLAITVLQVLALDIGTDLLPALALGAEPANPRTMRGPARIGALIDRRTLRRVFLVLGPVEAAMSLAAFLVVLARSGWTPGAPVAPATLALASGVAFSSIVLGQLANAFACRSETRWVGATGVRGNPLLLGAVAAELVVLLLFLLVPPFPAVLGGAFPDLTGWLLALAVIPVLLAADAADKALRGRR
ncbi:cation-translocating P-type ATPase [Allokutzneria albata]|uniref:ATPase, P-type (Transporting), HAD superfamily, subfamily IC n=1 Tax=Allokutzneria albata TaxID=211114 RepID=A0A1G9SJQ2_ALLAB|nr:cation-transporting P-type ATPase [Allokutzneria albata]SDM35726.1 ATPase, P-type (transporting), HAD superfamily, subfamily IC [Allokutzneria albata]